MKKMYVEGGKSKGSVAGIKVSKKGYMGGSKARDAKKVSRVNNIPGLMVKGPHAVGGG